MRAAQVLLLALVCFACKQPQVKRDHSAEVKQTLAAMRAAIQSFHQDNGRYPRTLNELVPKYLPRIPADPATGSASTWRSITEETVQPSADFTTNSSTAAASSVIIDVRSGAGAPYSNY
jgi:LmbE family N-acetylglucosaminyl deacetylase